MFSVEEMLMLKCFICQCDFFFELLFGPFHAIPTSSPYHFFSVNNKAYELE